MSTDLEKRIKELNSLISERDEEIQKETIALGKAIYKGSEGPPQGELKDPYLQAESLEKTIPEIQSEKKTIQKKADRLDAIAEQYKKYKKDIKNLDERLESFYIEIGKAAYTSYKDTQTPPLELREIFEDLEKSDDKIRNIDNDLYQMNKDGEGNFFNGIIQKGKSIVLNTRRKSISGSRVNQYSKAGEEFCKTPYFEESARDDLQELAAPYIEIRDAKAKILDDSGKLSIEEEKTKEELQKLCEGRSYRKALSDLERKLEETNRSIDEALHFLGDLFFHKPQKPLSEDKKIKDLIAGLKKLFADNKKDNGEITVLQAKIDIVELTALKQRKAERVRELDDQIQALKDAVQNLNKEMTKLDADIAEKQVIAGNKKKEG